MLPDKARAYASDDHRTTVNKEKSAGEVATTSEKEEDKVTQVSDQKGEADGKG